MSIDEIAQKIYERQEVNFALYETEIEKFQGEINELEKDRSVKDLYLEKIDKIKKDRRHLAFLYTLLLLKCFPDDRRIVLLSSTLAININDFNYAVKVLTSLKERTKSDDPSFTDILYLLAKSYRNANIFDDAVVYYRLAQDSYKEKGDTLNESWMIYSIGKMYLNYLQQPSKSIDLLLQAKQKFEDIGSDDRKKDRGISACLDELGDVYRQGLKDYNRAIETYNEAIEFNKNPKHYYPAGLSRNYCHLGICYKYLNNLTDAEGYLKKGIDILYSLPGQEKGLGIRLTQLGNVQVESKLFELGFKNLTIGQSYNVLYNNVEYIIYNLIYQGDYFYRSKKLDEAILRYQSAIEQSRNTFFYDLASISFQKLSSCYFELKLFNESRLAFIEGVNSNIKHWSNVKSGNPISIRVSEKVELGEMYQGLFFKLYDDYNVNFSSSITTLENVYNALISEYKQQRKNTQNVLRFGNIMSGIKHEIQNLHNNIIAVIDDIQRERTISDENDMLLTNLKKDIFEKSDILSNHNLKAVISNINEPLQISKITLSDLIYKITSDLRLKNLTFKNDLMDIKCSISIDEISFKYILLNLVLNSKEAFENNKAKVKNKVIEIQSGIEGSLFYLSVCDNAGGISNSDLTRIFDFGFSSKPGGTGYGLPSILALIESCNGNISVTNILHGTKATINFPTI